jgi:hypothetical protein
MPLQGSDLWGAVDDYMAGLLIAPDAVLDAVLAASEDGAPIRCDPCEPGKAA